MVKNDFKEELYGAIFLAAVQEKVPLGPKNPILAFLILSFLRLLIFIGCFSIVFKISVVSPSAIFTKFDK